ncbi:MAG: RnfABCDGE type electron transport complex subunit D [Calditrichaceae bacterium]
MTLETNRLLLMDSSPQMQAVESTSRIMYTVSLALMPAMGISVWFFGWQAFRVILLSALFCVGIEAVISKLVQYKINYLDGSALLTGLLLAMNLPANAPWWLIFIGSIVAIVLGKQVFGGLGQNIFNPALVARVFLLISFPVEMTSWLMPGKAADGITGATPLGILKTEGAGALVNTSFTDLAIGNMPGSLGEISAAALLLGALFLLYKKYITWEIPVLFILTVFLFTGVFYLSDPAAYASPVFHVLSGGLFLGALFMATDMVTSPLTFKGKLIFGIGCGLLTAIIRLFGSYPEGVSFAILLMNAVVPLIDKYFPVKRFGMVKNG